MDGVWPEGFSESESSCSSFGDAGDASDDPDASALELPLFRASVPAPLVAARPGSRVVFFAGADGACAAYDARGGAPLARWRASSRRALDAAHDGARALVVLEADARGRAYLARYAVRPSGRVDASQQVVGVGCGVAGGLVRARGGVAAVAVGDSIVAYARRRRGGARAPAARLTRGAGAGAGDALVDAAVGPGAALAFATRRGARVRRRCAAGYARENARGAAPPAQVARGDGGRRRAGAAL